MSERTVGLSIQVLPYSCSADTLTEPFLQTLDLLVMVLKLFGLTIMFMNIIVAQLPYFLAFLDRRQST